jgi:hypothetical protein
MRYGFKLPLLTHSKKHNEIRTAIYIGKRGRGATVKYAIDAKND